MSRATLRTAKLAVLIGALHGVSLARAQSGGVDRGSGGQASAPAASGDREAARAAFERGLSLVKESRYAEAKAVFLEAYHAYPHYLVLYNVAQADAQLGNLESAIAYLERFLREGADVLSSERRQQTSEQIRELRQRLSASPSPSEDDAAEGAALAPEPQQQGSRSPAPEPAPHLARRSPESDTSPTARPPSPAPTVSESKPRVTAPFLSASVAPAQPALAPEADKTWGLLLGASGIALLGTAAGLYLWNDSRHDGWKQDRQELDALPSRDDALASDLEVWRRAKANNELLESIERVDVVTLVTAGVGVLALGAGTWEVLAKRAPTPAIVASHPGLSWGSSW